MNRQIIYSAVIVRFSQIINRLIGKTLGIDRNATDIWEICIYLPYF